MVSRNEKTRMESFMKETTITRQKKIKMFWKYLDEQSDMHSHQGISRNNKSQTSETGSSTSSTGEAAEEGQIWRNGLRVFQQLGLHKIALAADKRCKLCHMDRMTKCKDLADTVPEPYEELNADMKAFEQRQESHCCNQSETSYARTSNAAFNYELRRLQCPWLTEGSSVGTVSCLMELERAGIWMSRVACIPRYHGVSDFLSPGGRCCSEQGALLRELPMNGPADPESLCDIWSTESTTSSSYCQSVVHTNRGIVQPP